MEKYPRITNVYGDGALFTSLDDQIKWEEHLFNPKLWDRDFNAKILQPLVIEDRKFYGFGLMHENYKGLRHTYHDGSTGAYNASFVRFPSENLSVVVISNNAAISTREIALQTAALAIDKNKLNENLKMKFETRDKQAKSLTIYYPAQQPQTVSNYRRAKFPQVITRRSTAGT